MGGWGVGGVGVSQDQWVGGYVEGAGCGRASGGWGVRWVGQGQRVGGVWVE